MARAAVRTLAPGRSTGAAALQAVDGQTLVRMYYLMRLARAIDDRATLWQRSGTISFVVNCRGHEAAQVGAGLALRPARDVVLPYYRDLGMVLALGMTPEEAMLNLLVRADDPNSGGRQMPYHFSLPRLRILTGSSPVGTQIPHAAGAALASRLRGEDAVTLVSFGEGATSEGDFHEGVNFAAVMRLPVVFFCQNNGYAISVPQQRQMAVPSVAARAAAYGIAGEQVDGRDPVAVYQAVERAIARARAGEGPTLLEAVVERLAPHTSDDDHRAYRSAEELQQAQALDPVPRFRERLVAAGVLGADEAQKLEEKVADTVEQAARVAQQAPHPDPATVARHVYFEREGRDDGAWRHHPGR